jgi:hypothetical protein
LIVESSTTTTKKYSNAGYLEKISTGYSFEDNNIRNLTFEYDKLSNVTNRSDHKLQVYENYTTHYLDKSYEETTYKDGTSDLKYFIYVGSKVISIYTDTTKTDESPSTKYLHYDNLNSVDTITNNLGVEQRIAYKPFGEKLSLDKYGNTK